MGVLIFSGPHGAGKDTLATKFHEQLPAAERIVRHITRKPTPGERDGFDYYFVNVPGFSSMVERGEFLEHSTYPDCMSGTSRGEVTSKAISAEHVSLVANFEESVPLAHSLGAMGLAHASLFISPIDRDSFTNGPDAYLDELRARMEGRGRPADRIENKLVKAAMYREMYLADQESYTYIDNGPGRLEIALRQVVAAAESIG
jgi:guanylate kinase